MSREWAGKTRRFPITRDVFHFRDGLHRSPQLNIWNRLRKRWSHEATAGTIYYYATDDSKLQWKPERFKVAIVRVTKCKIIENMTWREKKSASLRVSGRFELLGVNKTLNFTNVDTVTVLIRAISHAGISTRCIVFSVRRKTIAWILMRKVTYTQPPCWDTLLLF